MTSLRTGYSTLQILLHWAIAALVAFQLIFGESMTNTIDAKADGRLVDPFDATMASVHYWVGISVLALVCLRLVLRLRRGAPQRIGGPPLLTLAAAAVHWLFYALLVAVPVTGLLAFYFAFPFGDIHALGKPVFLVLIGLHALAALFHQFFLKDGTLRRMLVPAR